MRLRIEHTTTYHYDDPVNYGLQQIRLTPKNHSGQTVTDWKNEVSGGKYETEFLDQHHNLVTLLSMEEGTTEIQIRSAGIVETSQSDGIIGQHGGYAPLWYFKHQTSLTQPGKLVRKLCHSIAESDTDDITRMHALSSAIANSVTYETGRTNLETTAENALELGLGVCQDHSHIMLSAARNLGYPARYVSGYLMMNDRVEQDATHAWVEIYCAHVGWIGFDISNGISPDERYIRVATGLDYIEAAPVSGIRLGHGEERLQVEIQVQQ